MKLAFVLLALTCGCLEAAGNGGDGGPGSTLRTSGGSSSATTVGSSTGGAGGSSTGGAVCITGKVDFGNVQLLGTPSTGAVVIRNCGTSPVSGTFASLEGPQAADFDVTGESSTTLAPGASQTLTVTYSPAALGPSNADLLYTADLQFCTGCPSQSVDYNIYLSGVGVDGQLTFSPSPVNFETPPGGTAPTVEVTGTNTGTASITIASLGTYSDTNVFTLSDLATDGLTLPPLGDFTLLVTYNDPSNAAGDNDELLAVYTVSDPAVPARTAEDALLVGPPGPCGLSISPSTLNFGLEQVGSVATKQLTLANTCGTAYQVSAIALSPTTDPDFALAVGQATAFTVQPGSTRPIAVTFRAKSNQPPLLHIGQLTFQTTDPAQPSPSVPLSGTIN